MIYHIRVISDEDDKFIREIQIDSSITFKDLHNTLIKCCDYPTDIVTSFVLCDDSWEDIGQINMFDTGDKFTSTFVMDQTVVKDQLQKKDKLIYIFDMLECRGLYMEVTEVWKDKNLTEVVVTNSEGTAPTFTPIEEFNFEDITLDEEFQMPADLEEDEDILSNSMSIDDLPEGSY